MQEIHLRQAAEKDLIAIWQRSHEDWGVVQADRYLDELKEGMTTLAENPRLGSDCCWIRTGYRRLAVRHHVVYYRVTTRIEIIRILHQRMDPKRHLGSSGPE